MNDRASASPIIHVPLLHALLTATHPHTVASLARLCQLTTSQTLAELDRLRAVDCRFDEHPDLGLKLIEAGMGTWVDYLQTHANPPRVIHLFRQTATTQAACRRIVSDLGQRSHRALAITDEQTAGRGRL